MHRKALQLYIWILLPAGYVTFLVGHLTSLSFSFFTCKTGGMQSANTCLRLGMSFYTWSTKSPLPNYCKYGQATSAGALTLNLVLQPCGLRGTQCTHMQVL
jgi:hypothetical protein